MVVAYQNYDMLKIHKFKRTSKQDVEVVSYAYKINAWGRPALSLSEENLKYKNCHV
jgi:hypothetical protein